MSETCQKCWVLFPEQFPRLGAWLCNYVEFNFDVACFRKAYRHECNDGLLVSEIYNFLTEDCTLLLCFYREISRQSCYKLGLAHAFERNVILLNLSDTSRQVGVVPAFVRHRFKVDLILDANQPEKNYEIFDKSLRAAFEKIIFPNEIENYYRRLAEIHEEYCKASGSQIDLPSRDECIDRISFQKEDIDKASKAQDDQKVDCLLVCSIWQSERRNIALRIIQFLQKTQFKNVSRDIGGTLKSNQISEVDKSLSESAGSTYQLNAETINWQNVETTEGGKTVFNDGESV